MTITEIRLVNLRILIAEAGSKSELARRTGSRPAYFSQVDRREGEAYRNVGDDMARRLEQAMGRPHGWMDTEHSEQVPELATALRVAYRLLRGYVDTSQVETTDGGPLRSDLKNWKEAQPIIAALEKVGEL